MIWRTCSTSEDGDQKSEIRGRRTAWSVARGRGAWHDAVLFFTTEAQRAPRGRERRSAIGGRAPLTPSPLPDTGRGETGARGAVRLSFFHHRDTEGAERSVSVCSVSLWLVFSWSWTVHHGCEEPWRRTGKMRCGMMRTPRRATDEPKADRSHSLRLFLSAGIGGAASEPYHDQAITQFSGRFPPL
jgi:hypothetical protein